MIERVVLVTHTHVDYDTDTWQAVGMVTIDQATGERHVATTEQLAAVNAGVRALQEV